jgi:ABC-type multidrug transport system fused ATPase/permease subunit
MQRLLPMLRRTAVSLILAIISGGLSSIDPLLMRRLIDDALPNRHMTVAVFLALGIVGCLFGRTLFLILSLKVDFSVEQTIGQSLRISILEQLNRLSAHYHESTPAGDKMTRLQSDVDQVSQLGSEIISSLIRPLVLLIVNCFVMLRINTSMTLALLPAIVAFLFIEPHFARSLRRRADVAQNETGRASGILTEYISALPQLQLLCAERMIVKNAISAWSGMLEARKSQRNVELLYAATVQGAFVLSTFAILIVGSTQLVRGVLTIGSLVAFYAYSTRIFEPVSSLLDIASRLQRVGASIRRVQAILTAPETVPDFGTITKARTEIAQGISIQHLAFSYSGDDLALDDVSFHVANRGRIGIVGASGSGKSTLVRLLVRLADPRSGDITLDGYPIRDYKLAALRSTVCYVPQSPVLFQGTVAENLRYAKSDATDEDLMRVLSAVRLRDVINRLPEGLNNELGPFGRGLSGGEQQRLALARALLRSAPVLVLDESTSALDLATEQAVLKGIATFYPHSILIIISHRLASLTWLDQLIVLNAGRVVACGNHAVLQTSSAFYRSLYESHRTGSLVN